MTTKTLIEIDMETFDCHRSEIGAIYVERFTDGVQHCAKFRLVQSAQPVAYAASLDCNESGYIDAKAFREGEFTTPLYREQQSARAVPDDAEIEALAHRMCSQYRHGDGADPHYTFQRHTLLDFARALLAAAPAEQVAYANSCGVCDAGICTEHWPSAEKGDL